MAVPSYTTDLLTFNDCTSNTGWVEMTNMDVGGGADLDTDLGIVSDRCISELIRKTGLASLAYDITTAPTLATDAGYLVWSKYQAPNGISTRATDGIGIVIGSSVTDWGRFRMDGSDTYPYGGWVNYFVDPTLTPDATNGTYPTTDFSFLGTYVDVTNVVSKGNPQSIDFMRYGRGEARFTGGEAADYAVFSGFAAINDTASTNRWGLIQDVGGAYLWKGLMSLGLTATAVDMRDSNVNITIDDTIKAAASFNRIEVHNASSNVEWTSVQITKVGTVSKGEFEMIDNATVVWDGCVFTDMSTFIFDTNATIDATTWRRCGLVTLGGGTFDDCVFEENPGSASATTADIGDVTNSLFISDGSNHAVELSSIGAGTMSWDGNILSGYETGTAASPVTPTSTGNEAIYVNVVTASDLTINVAGGATIPSIRVGASFTGDVNVVATTNVTITGLRDSTEIRVLAAGTDTELAGIEAAIVGTTDDRSFTFALAATTSVDIFMVNITYVNIEIYAYAVPSTDASLPQAQQFDRVYFNP